MLALIGALVAGVLTTLAPCVLPLLPVIVGGSVGGVGAEDEGEIAAGGSVTTKSKLGFLTAAHKRALVIAGSLGVSIIVFTLVLKAALRSSGGVVTY